MKFFTGILASAIILCGTVTRAETIARSFFPALTAIAQYTVEQASLSAISLEWGAAVTPDPNW